MAKSSARSLDLRPRFDGILFFKSPDRRVKSRRTGEPGELIVMLDGVYTARPVSSRGREPVQAGAGDVVYWPAGVERVEENDPAKPTRCYTIYMRWPGAPLGLRRLVHDATGLIRMLAVQLLTLKQAPVALPAAVSDAFLSAIVAEYARLSMTPGDPLVAKVAAFVETRRAEPFRLADLSRFVGLERHHFGRAFKAKTGLSPMDYVRRKRIEHALGMLQSEREWTVRKVAARIGVRDDAELRRLFKRYTGLGARALRRIVRTRGADSLLSGG